MNYTSDEVIQYILEDDVKFIRLAFCDVFGRQKNISIMPEELKRAFDYGIAIDGSAIRGFGDETHSDLLLHPDPETLMQLPWRPEHGKVVLMYSTISWPDGKKFACDTRSFLKQTIEEAKSAGCQFSFGAEQEFYLFQLDEEGEPTKKPFDHASYMDIAPDDRGENVRREICLTLEQMGIRPESSHHEEGPGQNEIDFRYSDALTAADNVMTFQNVVKTVARRNGLAADFSPKPLEDEAGNGFHINMSVNSSRSSQDFENMIAGILDKICEITLFLNPTEESYHRFGQRKAPKYVSWSHENRSQLIRIPAAIGEFRRCELRSPDPMTNPYLAYGLLIQAALEGIKEQRVLPGAADFNLFRADEETLKQFQILPESLAEAKKLAGASTFVRSHLPEELLEIYLK
ncbi:MAG: glutamine synthetase [Parasporobacterium sp.]|nr:glutamine synthetase [Parasporobacterium sp.]